MPRRRDLWYTCDPFVTLFNAYRYPWLVRVRVGARVDRYTAAWGTVLDASHA